MNRRRRIPFWYLLPLVAALGIGLWLGRALSTADSSVVPTLAALQTPVAAGTARVEVQVTVVVEKFVQVTVVVERQVTQIVERVITATPAPAATPAPTSTPDPIETRLAQAKASATALAPVIAAAVATKEAALAAAFRATNPPLLGQAVDSNGLGLIARSTYHPGPNRGDNVHVSFAADNKTGQRLNFNIRPADFYLELSNGRRYPGSNNPIAVNGFDTDTRRDFSIELSLNWTEFAAFQRDSAITHYFVVATTFGEGRITNAKWCDEIRGTPCR